MGAFSAGTFVEVCPFTLLMLRGALPDASSRLETGIAREFAELFFVVLAKCRRRLGGASTGAAVGDGRARKSYLPKFEVLYDVYEP